MNYIIGFNGSKYTLWKTISFKSRFDIIETKLSFVKYLSSKIKDIAKEYPNVIIDNSITCNEDHDIISIVRNYKDSNDIKKHEIFFNPITKEGKFYIKNKKFLTKQSINKEKKSNIDKYISFTAHKNLDKFGYITVDGQEYKFINNKRCYYKGFAYSIPINNNKGIFIKNKTIIIRDFFKNGKTIIIKDFKIK